MVECLNKKKIAKILLLFTLLNRPYTRTVKGIEPGYSIGPLKNSSTYRFSRDGCTSAQVPMQMQVAIDNHLVDHTK